MASVAGDNEALKLELSRQLKQDMARTSAPFAAVSTTVEFLSNLSLAIQTQKRLDSMERVLASRLGQDPRNCGLIRVNAWNNVLTGRTEVGQPILLGIGRNPVNLIVESEVQRAIRGVVEAVPSGNGWVFDGTKAFFMCYTRTADGNYRRGLVPYQRAIESINDKGQELIQKAYAHAYMAEKFAGANSWWCAYDKQYYASPADCDHLEMGGTWSTRRAGSGPSSVPPSGKSLTKALAEPY
jgi:hypothetical protein